MTVIDLDLLRRLFKDLFDVPADEVDMDTAMDDLFEWDSISHVELVIRLETLAGIRLTPEEIVTMTSVKAILSKFKPQHST